MSTKPDRMQRVAWYPYRYGGTTERGIDCSAFTREVFRNAIGIELPAIPAPRSTKARVSKQDLVEGTWSSSRSTRVWNHVGIYVGNGEFIHVSFRAGVTRSKLDNVLAQQVLAGTPDRYLSQAGQTARSTDCFSNLT